MIVDMLMIMIGRSLAFILLPPPELHQMIDAYKHLRLRAQPFDSPPSNHQLIEVTGGQELTIISTADSAVMSNARFEVRDSSKLILDIPDLTITGVVDSVGKNNTWDVTASLA